MPPAISSSSPGTWSRTVTSHGSTIHVLQYRLRDRFQFLENVPEAGTVAFGSRARSRPPRPARSPISATSRMTRPRRRSLRDGPAPSDQTVNVAAAHVMFYHHLGRVDRALALLAKYRDLGFDQQGEFPWMLRDYFPGAPIESPWVAPVLPRDRHPVGHDLDRRDRRLSAVSSGRSSSWPIWGWCPASTRPATASGGGALTKAGNSIEEEGPRRGQCSIRRATASKSRKCSSAIGSSVTAWSASRGSVSPWTVKTIGSTLKRRDRPRGRRARTGRRADCR